MQEVQRNAERIAHPPGGAQDGVSNDACCDLDRLIELVQNALQYVWNKLAELFKAVCDYFSPESPREDLPPEGLGVPHLMPLDTTNPFTPKCNSEIEAWLRTDPFGRLEIPYQVKTTVRIYPHYAQGDHREFVSSQDFNEESTSLYPEAIRQWISRLVAKFRSEAARFDLATVKVGFLACATKTEENDRKSFIVHWNALSGDLVHTSGDLGSFDPDTGRTVLLSEKEVEHMCWKELQIIDKAGQPLQSDAMQLGDMPLREIPEL